MAALDFLGGLFGGLGQGLGDLQEARMRRNAEALRKRQIEAAILNDEARREIERNRESREAQEFDWQRQRQLMERASMLPRDTEVPSELLKGLPPELQAIFPQRTISGEIDLPEPSARTLPDLAGKERIFQPKAIENVAKPSVGDRSIRVRPLNPPEVELERKKAQAMKVLDAATRTKDPELEQEAIRQIFELGPGFKSSAVKQQEHKFKLEESSVAARINAASRERVAKMQISAARSREIQNQADMNFRTVLGPLITQGQLNIEDALTAIKARDTPTVMNTLKEAQDAITDVQTFAELNKLDPTLGSTWLKYWDWLNKGDNDQPPLSKLALIKNIDPKLLRELYDAAFEGMQDAIISPPPEVAPTKKSITKSRADNILSEFSKPSKQNRVDSILSSVGVK